MRGRVGVKVGSLFVCGNTRVGRSFTLDPPRNSENISYESEKVDPILSRGLRFVGNFCDTRGGFSFIVERFGVGYQNKRGRNFLVFCSKLAGRRLLGQSILRDLVRKSVSLSPRRIKRGRISREVVARTPLDALCGVRRIVRTINFNGYNVFVSKYTYDFITSVGNFNTEDINRPMARTILSNPRRTFIRAIVPGIKLVEGVMGSPGLVYRGVGVKDGDGAPYTIVRVGKVAGGSLLSRTVHHLRNVSVRCLFSSARIRVLVRSDALFPLPRVLGARHPSETTSVLARKGITILIRKDPFTLVLPTATTSLVRTSRSGCIETRRTGFVHVMELFKVFLSLFLPKAFITITVCRRRSVPASLLFTVRTAHRVMPFSLVKRLLLVRLTFRLVGRTSVEVPDPVKSALNVINKLVLNRTTISTGLMDPVLVVVMSITKLKTFTVPSISLSHTMSTLHFIFVVLNNVTNFLNLTTKMLMDLSTLTKEASFNIPCLSPLAPHDGGNFVGALLVTPL